MNANPHEFKEAMTGEQVDDALEVVLLDLEKLPALAENANEEWKRQLIEDVNTLKGWLEYHATTGGVEIDVKWAEAGLRLIQRTIETEELTKP